MHYFQQNIGDYAVATRHLSNMEDLAYRRMMDLYYDKEAPLILDINKLSRLIRMQDNKEEIISVLDDFFVETENGYTQSRIEKEIANYKDKAEKARANGKLGGRPPKKTPQPKAPKETKVADPLLFDEWESKPSEKVLSEWLAHRKKRKLSISQLVVNKMTGEINKAVKMGYSVDTCLSEIIERGWQGFNSDWIKNGSATKTVLHNLSDKDYSQHEGAL